MGKRKTNKSSLEEKELSKISGGVHTGGAEAGRAQHTMPPPAPTAARATPGPHAAAPAPRDRFDAGKASVAAHERFAGSSRALANRLLQHIPSREQTQSLSLADVQKRLGNLHGLEKEMQQHEQAIRTSHELSDTQRANALQVLARPQANLKSLVGVLEQERKKLASATPAPAPAPAPAPGKAAPTASHAASTDRALTQSTKRLSDQFSQLTRDLASGLDARRLLGSVHDIGTSMQAHEQMLRKTHKLSDAQRTIELKSLEKARHELERIAKDLEPTTDIEKKYSDAAQKSNQEAKIAWQKREHPIQQETLRKAYDAFTKSAAVLRELGDEASYDDLHQIAALEKNRTALDEAMRALLPRGTRLPGTEAERDRLVKSLLANTDPTAMPPKFAAGARRPILTSAARDEAVNFATSQINHRRSSAISDLQKAQEEFEVSALRLKAVELRLEDLESPKVSNLGPDHIHTDAHRQTGEIAADYQAKKEKLDAALAAAMQLFPDNVRLPENERERDEVIRVLLGTTKAVEVTDGWRLNSQSAGKVTIEAAGAKARAENLSALRKANEAFRKSEAQQQQVNADEDFHTDADRAILKQHQTNAEALNDALRDLLPAGARLPTTSDERDVLIKRFLSER